MRRKHKRKPQKWLTEREIAKLRALHDQGYPLKTLALRFGISKSGASRIVNYDRRADAA